MRGRFRGKASLPHVFPIPNKPWRWVKPRRTVIPTIEDQIGPHLGGKIPLPHVFPVPHEPRGWTKPRRTVVPTIEDQIGPRLGGEACFLWVSIPHEPRDWTHQFIPCFLKIRAEFDREIRLVW